ncbi:MAG: sensor histidine kinase, partial [Solirubrobacteraceae bacterium]
DNAIKWSPPSSPVEVTVLRGALSVRDHGPGVPPEDRDHIFDRFYRGAGARAHPGSGLGLAIVRQVAQQHGGSVSVTNAADGGAIFNLWLPGIPADAAGADDGDRELPTGSSQPVNTR